MKYIDVAQVPRVTTVHNYLTVLADVAKILIDFYGVAEIKR